MKKTALALSLLFLLASTDCPAQSDILPTYGLFTDNGVGVPYWATKDNQAVPGDFFSFSVTLPQSKPYTIVVFYYRSIPGTGHWAQVQADAAKDPQRRYTGSDGHLSGSVTASKSGVVSIFVPHGLKKIVDQKSEYAYNVRVYDGTRQIENKLIQINNSLPLRAPAVKRAVDGLKASLDNQSDETQMVAAIGNPDGTVSFVTQVLQRTGVTPGDLPDWKIVVLQNLSPPGE